MPSTPQLSHKNSCRNEHATCCQEVQFYKLSDVTFSLFEINILCFLKMQYSAGAGNSVGTFRGKIISNVETGGNNL